MSRPAPFDETAHRVHDYGHLVTRWRRVARAAGLTLEPFAQAGEFPLYCVRSRDRSDGGLYLSAGIHGDEPAPPEALLRWAETRLPALVRGRRTLPLLILPCLNPWGLVNNRREDEEGRDLNRLFHRKSVPVIAALRKVIARRRFDLTLNLHEDYDARGIYLYELHRRAPDWGDSLVERCAAVIPADTRRRIDDNVFENGVARRRVGLERLGIHAEAIHLYLHHAPQALTFETPSEFSLARRVRAHVLLVEECVRRLLQDRSAGPPG